MPKILKIIHQMKDEIKRYHLPYIFVHFGHAAFSKIYAELLFKPFLVIFSPV